MKILVCISHVPDTTAKIQFTSDARALDANGVQFVINPYDEFGLTRALQLNEQMQFGDDILQAAPNTLSVMHQGVKLSFFGGLSLGVVEPPDLLDNCPIASLPDLGACKLAALVNRVELKDYLDVAALLRGGADLSYLLGCAEAVYHGAFPTAACLKSLTWFDDPALAGLGPDDRLVLERAALSVETVPTVSLSADRIGQ